MDGQITKLNIWIFVTYFAILQSCTSGVVPVLNEKEAEPNCQDDPNCVAFQQKFKYLYIPQFDDVEISSNRVAGGGTQLECDSIWNKFVCEQLLGKICYTGGECANLVEEEIKAI